jgi:hypothetical protein
MKPVLSPNQDHEAHSQSNVNKGRIQVSEFDHSVSLLMPPGLMLPCFPDNIPENLKERK